MYEDSWYSFVPESTKKAPASSSSGGHKRRPSLLQQPNGPSEPIKPLDELLEKPEEDEGPAVAEVLQRSKSCSNLRGLEGTRQKKEIFKVGLAKKDKTWEALQICGHESRPNVLPERPWDALDDQLAESSIEEYTYRHPQPFYRSNSEGNADTSLFPRLYMDQLTLTQRHLDSLISGTNDSLKILASLSDSFRVVEEQTSTFQAQCQDLLSEQKRLQKVADDVGTDLHYYAYLDTVARRLNAPGATRLAEDEGFSEILDNLDQCVEFMQSNPEYRDSESYQARYQSLLTKALHLLETAFSSTLEKVSSDLAGQIASTTSDSARHALAYGRFSDLLLESSRSLIPNLHRTFRRVYHEYGAPSPLQNINRDMYLDTAQNLVNSLLSVRDRDLKPIVVHDLESLKAEATRTSPETATRNFLKQSFERAWNEFGLFKKIFGVEPHFNNDPEAAFQLLKSHQRQLVNIGNLGPMASQTQQVLQTAGLNGICVVVGWLTDEYLMIDPADEDEDAMSEFGVVCQELTARLLSENLWSFTDAAFEAEIAKMARAPVVADATLLKPQGNAYPMITKAVELLSLFDGCMPKERCQKSSPIIFRLIQTSISALQKAESRLRSQFNPRAPSSAAHSTDPDLFMVKNLLVLKNSLVSLEIGDARDSAGGAAQGGMLGGLSGSSLQHFGQIWDALTPATTNLIGWVGSFLPGWKRRDSSASFNSAAPPLVRPGSSASSMSHGHGHGHGHGHAAGWIGAGASGGHTHQQDASEILDELLRKSIIAFTQRWGQKMHEARVSGGKKGSGVGGPAQVGLEKELDQVLGVVFSTQPEVSAKLKEAIDDSVKALATGKGTFTGTVAASTAK
ncbi:Conserved oligomeric Golgi complex subunit 3 [Zalerion maritima]|uniref:Conserved oligomeric Golgi complex subunit 3 n=1 Tax=Zalerion maritima TaxID=339359 RepID=A0AAD5RL58_9PEZI|nr:Conserved oligomeric Golgi complex subunit 3 [Zalerion maritima]